MRVGLEASGRSLKALLRAAVRAVEASVRGARGHEGLRAARAAHEVVLARDKVAGLGIALVNKGKLVAGGPASDILPKLGMNIAK